MLNYEIYNNESSYPIHLPLWRAGNQTGRQFVKKVQKVKKKLGEGLSEFKDANSFTMYLYNVSYEYQLKDWKLYTDKHITMGRDGTKDTEKYGGKSGVVGIFQVFEG